MCTPFASDWPVQSPEWPGFRMFPPLPSNDKARNPVRVPPRAQHDPSSEGSFALKCRQLPHESLMCDAGLCLAPG